MMRRDNTTAHEAFSLVELLVVLAVLAVLVGLVVPGIARLAAISRRALCANHLGEIARAYYSCKFNETSKGLTSASFNPFQAQISAQAIGAADPQFAEILSPDNWGSVLRPYLGGERALHCPSFDPGSEFGVLPDIRVRVYGDGGAEKSDYEIYVTGAFEVWNYGSASECYVPPGIWRRSTAPQAEDFPEWQDAVDKMEQYEPGDNPNVSWYMLETARYGDDYHAGGDLDWNDLILKVTETSSSVIVEPYQIFGWAGQVYNLYDADSGAVYGSETESVGRDGNLGPFEFAKTTVSYGMNSHEELLTPGLHRVLALDYGHRTCYSGPTVREDVPWESLKAPRHLGKSNAVFSDGAVEQHDPDLINPEASDENYRAYWAPIGLE